MINDFPDWLSPVVVKELRQGLRSKVFLLLLIAPQAIVSLVAIGGALKGEARSFNGVFWAIVGTVALMAAPLQGLFAVSREIKESKMDLLLLTNLSPRRIILGKWSGIVLQVVLLLTSLLPYLILSYFSGEVLLTKQLEFLWLFFTGSCLLIGVALMLSPFMVGVMGRILIAVGALFLFLAFPAMLMAHSFARRGGFEISGFELLVLTPLFLEGAVKWISPKGLNSTARLRLLMLGYSFLIGGAYWMGWDFLARVGFIVLLPFFGILLFEEPLSYDRVYEEASGWKRSLCWFLRQGWVSATFFSLTLVSIIGLFTTGKEWLLLLSGLTATVFPLLFVRYLRSRVRVLLYWVIQGAALIGFLMLKSVGLEKGLGLLPPVWFYQCLSKGENPGLLSVFQALFVFGVPLLIYWLMQRRTSIQNPL